MARQVGGAIGLAVLIAIASGITAHSHAATTAARTVHGYNIALLIAAPLTLLVTLCGVAAHTPAHRHPTPATAHEVENTPR